MAGAGEADEAAAVPPPHGWLAPFRLRTYRFQWPADLATSWAFEMETLILGWYVLVETGSVLALTILGALQYVGTVLAPLTGVAGDRLGHRTVLVAIRAVYSVLSAVLLGLAVMHLLSPAAVFVIAGLMGLLRPSDLGVRSALTAATMPPGVLMGAMSLSRTIMDSARIAGAVVGSGVFAALGIAAAYVLVVLFYATGMFLTLGTAKGGRARPVQANGSQAPIPSPWRDLRDGVAYVWSRPWLRGAMLLAFLINLTALPLTSGLLPYVARDIYHADQRGLGLLVASFAGGALLGSLVLSRIGPRLAQGRIMLKAAMAWFVIVLCFAQMRAFAGGAAFLVLAGVAQSCSLVPLVVMILRTSDPEMLGRVMGARMLAIYSLPLGLLISGFAIPWLGFPAAMTLYALVGLGGVALIAVRWHGALWQDSSVANAR